MQCSEFGFGMSLSYLFINLLFQIVKDTFLSKPSIKNTGEDLSDNHQIGGEIAQAQPSIVHPVKIKRQVKCVIHRHRWYITLSDVITIPRTLDATQGKER